MKKLRILLFAVFILFSIGYASQSDKGENEAEIWNKLNSYEKAERIGYLFDGIRVFAKESADKETKEIFYLISLGQYLKAIDKFYSDDKNRNAGFPTAFLMVNKQIRGENTDKIKQSIFKGSLTKKAVGDIAIMIPDYLREENIRDGKTFRNTNKGEKLITVSIEELPLSDDLKKVVSGQYDFLDKTFQPGINPLFLFGIRIINRGILRSKE